MARPRLTAPSARASKPTGRWSTTKVASTASKINFITYDDGFSPPKTVEMVKKLGRERQGLRDLPDARHGVQYRHPQVHEPGKRKQFLRHTAHRSGATQAGSRTTSSLDDITESAIYAKHILYLRGRHGKIGILEANDDSGKDYVSGFMKGLGKENEKLVVSNVSYEVTDHYRELIYPAQELRRHGLLLATPRPSMRRRRSARRRTSVGSPPSISSTFQQ